MTDNEIILRASLQKEIAKKAERWDPKRKTQTQNTEEPRARIIEMFIKEGWTDAKMINALKTEPFKLTPTDLGGFEES